jgi:hypothetical protein
MVITLGVFFMFVSIRNIFGIFVRIWGFFVLPYFRDNGNTKNPKKPLRIYL